MLLLLSAIKQMLSDNISGGQAVAPGLKPTSIYVAHISDIQNPEFPAITLMQQLGNSILPVGGWEEGLALVQVWSRKGVYESIRLYDWVASIINMRAREITDVMNQLPDFPRGGTCHTFYRQWKAWPLYDLEQKVWYVTARYTTKYMDRSDLYAAWGGPASAVDGVAVTPQGDAMGFIQASFEMNYEQPVVL